MPLRGVHTRLTRVAWGSGFLEEGQNLEMSTAGELRRRRGYVRSNVVKKNASISNLAGFSAFNGQMFLALADGDRIQGYEDIAATENIDALSAPSGHVDEYHYQRYHVMVVRGLGGVNHDIDGFEVFAKPGSSPVSATEDGVRAAGFLPIDRNSFVSEGYWYAPSAGAWKFSARAVRDKVTGPIGPLTTYVAGSTDQDDGGDFPPWLPNPPPDPPLLPPPPQPVGVGGGVPWLGGEPLECPDPDVTSSSDTCGPNPGDNSCCSGAPGWVIDLSAVHSSCCYTYTISYNFDVTVASGCESSSNTWNISVGDTVEVVGRTGSGNFSGSFQADLNGGTSYQIKMCPKSVCGNGSGTAWSGSIDWSYDGKC